MKTKKFLKCTATLLFLLGFAFGCASPKTKSEKDTARDSLRAMTERVLAKLYQDEPAAKGAVAGAAGYAVFSDYRNSLKL